MKLKIVFSILSALLSTLLIFVILFFRVDDVTFDDHLGLLGCMLTFYVPVLLVLALLCITAAYYKESGWSIVFAALFIGYFVLVPWLIEPLRIIDTLFHFSRVVVVMQKGYLPSTQSYYFDYPGSTVFGVVFLAITGIEPTLFLRSFFPLMQTAIFLLGFMVIVRKIFRSWLPIGPSLLLISIFGYGGLHFSPFGFAWMILPVLLLTLMAREKMSSSLCFIMLSISLVMSHPTTAAFLTTVLPASVFTLMLSKKISYERRNSLILCVFIFVATTLSWSYFIAPRTLAAVAAFVQSVGQALFFHSQNVPEMVWQHPNFLFEISFLRRAYVVLSGILAITLLALSIRKMWRNTRVDSHVKDWIGLSITFICAGLLLFLLFSISSNPVFSFEYSFSFGLFGAALVLGLLFEGSRKAFSLLLIIILSLIVPAFIVKYPVEYEDLVREPIINGLQFTGASLNITSSTILSPFATQLYSFTKYENWANIIFVSYDNKLLSQVEVSNYFIYRVDGLYHAAAVAYEPANQTLYFQLSTSLLNETNFNLVYSTEGYEIFARTTP